MDKVHTVTLDFDIDNAEMIQQVLQVDHERSNTISKTFTTTDGVLTVEFKSQDLKLVRTSVNSFLEHMGVCCETIEAFGDC